jgi:hypothetical protein
MKVIEQQQRVANFLAALAHLLTGQPGRFNEFRERADMTLSGAPPRYENLAHFSSQFREPGRPLLWVHFSQGNPSVPEIGLVTDVGRRKHYVENCILYLPKGADRAILVPDGFKMGAYRFDNALNLRHRQNAPKRTFEAAREDVIRAYLRLSSIQAEQWERGDVFDLPFHAKAA